MKWRPNTLGQLCCCLMLVWSALSIVTLLGGHFPLALLKDSVGYGDSYNLMTVEHFQATGQLYPALTPEHPTPNLYSPLLYISLAAANALVPSDSHFLGPRVFELISFLFCIVAAGLLARELIPVSNTFVLGLVLAASFSSMTFWVFQLRSDFPSIFLNLTSVYLLLRASKHSSLPLLALAGACAGLAIQFKFTMAAAAVAGLLWLLILRRWSYAGIFIASVVSIGAGGYTLFSIFEPNMLSNILVLAKMVPDGSGTLAMLLQVLSEPVMLFGITAFLSLLPLVLAFRRNRFLLVALFGGLSLSMGALTSLQAGGNINYFYEVMFATVPFGAFGYYRLWSLRRHQAIPVLAMGILLSAIVPGAIQARRAILSSRYRVSDSNQRHDALRLALRGSRLLSTVPDVTILTPDRYITEPYLLHLLTLTKGTDLTPLTSMILRHQFDAIATQWADYSWRGVTHLDPSIREAIVDSYQPACRIGEALFHLPPGDPGRMQDRLAKAGCRPEACGPGLPCPGLQVRQELFPQ